MSNIKLNVGCGIFYKPGYINIDIFSPNVADLTQDIRKLEFNVNSIQEIHASHILEHFDIISLPYLLADWIQLLEPKGIIHIETPYLKKGANRLSHLSYMEQINEIRFLYGIDFQGNSHKSGFNPNLLKFMLEQAGFTKITKIKPNRYLKEKSFGLEAQKPEKSAKFTQITWINHFRSEIWRTLDNTDVLLLDAIEHEIIDEINEMLVLKGIKFFSKEVLPDYIARTWLFKPELAKILLQVIPKKYQTQINLNGISSEISKESIQKLYYLFEKSKKTPQNKKGFQKDYVDFISYWKQQFTQIFGSTEFIHDDWNYYNSIEISNPGVYQNFSCFSKIHIQLAGTYYYNKAIQAFSQKNYLDCMQYMLKVPKFLHYSKFYHWNLVHLKMILGYSKKEIYAEFNKIPLNKFNKSQRNQLLHEIDTFKEKANETFQIKKIEWIM